MAYLRACYTLDLRALGLMRIGTGIVLLVDLLIRSFSLRAHYSDEGVLTVSVLKQYNWNPYYFSFHAISGEVWFEALLFVLNAACVVMLIAGYRSRLFTFICWAFLVSLQNRNPFILQGGDDLLRMLLFWGIFLPWGSAYAVRQPARATNAAVSFANAGYLLLIASVYFFSAMLKTSPEWHEEGSAVYYALSLDQMRLPLGTLVYRFPWLMTFLTHLVYWIEVIAPLLLLLPLRNKWCRVAGIAAITLLQLGIMSCLYVGLFYIIALVALTGLLPSPVMDALERRFFGSGASLVKEEEEETRSSPLASFVRLNVNLYCIVLALYCLIMNLSQVSWFKYELQYSLLNVSHLLRLEQSWGMFSPAVLKDDGWYVYDGYTADGRHIDLSNGATVDFSKPANVVTTYESDRWRKFGENYVFNNNNHMRPYFCRYLIRSWNEKHPTERVVEATVFYMQETSLPGYQVKPLTKIAACNCQDKAN